MNVLVLMCDQLRYDAVGFHGNELVSTPNIDRLARKSVRFTNAFCNSPLCGPTRHSLATGLYPYRHGVVNNVMLPVDPMYTIAHHLGGSGFETTCIGHMHWQRIETNDGREDVFPDHGYDEYLAVHPDHSALSEDARLRRMWEKAGLTSRRTAGPSIVPDSRCYSRQIADASIGKLRHWAASGTPFLSWTSFNDPHPPFFPPPEYYRKYAGVDLPAPRRRPSDARPSQDELSDDPIWAAMTPLDHRVMKTGYYGLVELADHHLGRVLSTLDELDLWDDTIVVFTVDHGEMMGDYGRYFKSVMWEQAVHVPLYVYYPGVTAGDCPDPAEHVDVFPTLCDLLGLPIPTEVQGRSLKDAVFRGTKATDQRAYVLSQLKHDLMIRTERWKLVLNEDGPKHLFDLSADPEESYDVKEENPDVIDELRDTLRRDHPELRDTTNNILHSGRLRKHKRKPTIQLTDVP